MKNSTRLGSDVIGKSNKLRPVRYRLVAKRPTINEPVTSSVTPENFYGRLQFFSNSWSENEQGKQQGDKISITFNNRGLFGTQNMDGEVYHMTIPEYGAWVKEIEGDDLHKYALYRSGIWHEDQHIAHTPVESFMESGSMPPLRQYITNALEDVRIETKAFKKWKGMKAQRALLDAHYWGHRPSISELSKPKDKMREAFIQQLLFGRVKGSDLTEGQQEQLDKAIQVSKEAVAKSEPLKDEKGFEIIRESAERVTSILGLDDKYEEPPYDDEGHKNDSTTYKVDKEQLKKAVEEYLKDKIEKKKKSPDEQKEIDKVKKETKDKLKESEEKADKDNPIDKIKKKKEAIEETKKEVKDNDKLSDETKDELKKDLEDYEDKLDELENKERENASEEKKQSKSKEEKEKKAESKESEEKSESSKEESKESDEDKESEGQEGEEGESSEDDGEGESESM
ncbi:MAG: hypothetical protein AABY22_11930, partial [Nanoarchaeota archaeon]